MESTVMITVWTGSAPPPPLESLPVPELAHLEVFTSRTSEDGRSRYRLHLGYFEDSTAAKRVLPRVREVYPSAWVVPADRHRPLARLKSRTMPAMAPLELAPPTLTASPAQLAPPTPTASPAQLAPQLQFAPPAELTPLARAVQPLPEAQPPATVVLKPFARQDLSAELTDEISLDMSAILALLQEESDPPTSPSEPSLAAETARGIPAARVPRTMRASRAATSQPAFHDAFSAISRLIVEEWHAEIPVARAAPNHSWFRRLPKLARGGKPPR